MLSDIGIHINVEADEYHEWKCASASNLKEFRRSPLHAFEAMNGPRKQPTPAMLLGTACHHAILEPRIFRDLYAVADQCCAVTGKGKRCSNIGKVVYEGTNWYCGMHMPETGVSAAAVTVLAPEDFDRCLRMADSVNRHAAAQSVLDLKEHTEASAIWRDIKSGVLCKLRADLLCEDGIVGDLKTTSDAGREAFEKSIFGFGYWIQAALYLSGLNALGGEFDHFCIIAVESAPPFAVAVYRLQDDVIGAGREEIEGLLTRWAECERVGKWPGYSDRFEDVGLPEWAWRKLEQLA
jgi:hypothetical protein